MNFQEEAGKIIEKCNDAVLTSVGEDGYPRSCFMGIMGYDSFSEIYFSTGANGTKVRHFKQNAYASVTYKDGADSVTLVGEVEIITDPAMKQRFWGDWMLEHFPKGVNDYNYCLLKFTGTEATYWINHEFLRDEPIV